MPVLGNNAIGAYTSDWSPTEMVGHLDRLNLLLWDNPIPTAFRIIAGYVYLRSSAGQLSSATMQMGIYYADAVALPSTWGLAFWSNPLVVAVNPVPQWYAFTWPGIVLPAGWYALAVISNTNGADGFTGRKYSTAKVNGTEYRTGIIPGTFPDPVGVPTGSRPDNDSFYIDWLPAGRYSPTAACTCQPTHNTPNGG